jgi:hypothetical protein
MHLTKKQLALITLMIFLVSVMIPPISSALAENGPTLFQTIPQDQKQKARNLMQIAVDVNERVMINFDIIEENNETIPQDLIDLYNEGLTLGEDAKEHFERGQFEESSSKTVEAMNLFEQILVSLEKNINDEPSTIELRAEEFIVLKNILNRTYSLIDKIEVLSDGAEDAGQNVAEIRTNLVSARRHLLNASLNIEAGNIDDAKKELSQATSLLDLTADMLDGINSILELERVQDYVELYKMRVSQLEKRIRLFSSIDEETRTNLLGGLTEVKNNIQNAEKILSNVNDAVNALTEVKYYEEKLFSTVSAENPELVDFLAKIGRIEWTVLDLERNIKRLATGGVDVSDSFATLNRTKQILNNLPTDIGEDLEQSLERANLTLQVAQRQFEENKEGIIEKVKKEIQSNINELEVKIKTLLERIDQLKVKGIYLSRAEKMINYAFDLIEQINLKLRTNLTSVPESSFDIIHEIVDQVEIMVFQAEERLNQTQEIEVINENTENNEKLQNDVTTINQ